MLYAAMWHRFIVQLCYDGKVDLGLDISNKLWVAVRPDIKVVIREGIMCVE